MSEVGQVSSVISIAMTAISNPTNGRTAAAAVYSTCSFSHLDSFWYSCDESACSCYYCWEV